MKMSMSGLQRILTPNGTANVPQEARPDQRFSTLSVLGGYASSRYDSLQIFGKQRFARGIDLSVAYTFSRSRDNSSSEVTWQPSFPSLINLGANISLSREIFMNRKNETTSGKKRRKAGVATIALLLLTGLAPAASVRMNNAPIRPQQKEKRYELRGVVKSVDRPNRRATIKHEKVGDYMDAMTMPFVIKDEKALKTMQPGDQIKATLVVTDDGGQWLENVALTSKVDVSLEEKTRKLKLRLKRPEGSGVR